MEGQDKLNLELEERIAELSQKGRKQRKAIEDYEAETKALKEQIEMYGNVKESIEVLMSENKALKAEKDAGAKEGGELAELNAALEEELEILKKKLRDATDVNTRLHTRDACSTAPLQNQANIVTIYAETLWCMRTPLLAL